MKSANEIRLMQEEKFKDYYMEQQLKREQDNEGQLKEIEALLLSVSSNRPDVHYVNYDKDLSDTEVKEILLQYGYHILHYYDQDIDCICTMIEW